MLKKKIEISLDDVTQRDLKLITSREFSSEESWAEVFAAAGIWLEEAGGTLISIEPYKTDEGDFYLTLFVDCVENDG